MKVNWRRLNVEPLAIMLGLYFGVKVVALPQALANRCTLGGVWVDGVHLRSR